LEIIMKIIGLCGGSGSGKGSVCDLFALYGIPSVDTDMVYRDLTSGRSDCLEALVSEFGEDILTPLGSLDRAKLRLAVFGGADAEMQRRRLNEITHSHILDRTREILSVYEKEGRAFAIVDAPLLFEYGLESACDTTVGVTTDIETAVRRLAARDGKDESEIRGRLAAQHGAAYFEEHCDHIARNTTDLASLRKELDELLGQILQKTTAQ
jgi:dephospho-CoA kinase